MSHLLLARNRKRNRNRKEADADKQQKLGNAASERLPNKNIKYEHVSRGFRLLDFGFVIFRLFGPGGAVASMTKSSVYFRVGLWLRGFS